MKIALLQMNSVADVDANIKQMNDVAEKAVLDLGATKHEHQTGKSFRVFLDPAGHPFCLCQE